MTSHVAQAGAVASVAAMTVTLAIACGATAVPEPRVVSLDINFTLTDLDYAPLSGVPVRLAFGSDRDWQAPSTGLRFVTDAGGAYHGTEQVELDKRRRRLPTNFADPLLSRQQVTDHLMVAAEFGYLTHQWVYTVDVYRFPGGDSAVLDAPAVYTPDATGRFTRQARVDAAGWHMPELGTMVLTKPGYEPWDFLLQPDGASPTIEGWALRLAFKRSPAPVVR